MTCPYCKQPIESKTVVCHKCGFRLKPEQPVSAYDVLRPSVKPRPSLELVLAILSIPAALMPLLGFGLGLPALFIARKHKATTPMILAMLGILLSLAVLIFNIVYYAQYAG